MNANDTAGPTSPALHASGHALATADALKLMGVRADHGLASTAVDERHRIFGSNSLRQQAPRPPWLKFLDQFKSLLIIVLIAAALLAAAVGNLKDAGVIIAVVLFNATARLLSGTSSGAEPRGAARHAARQGECPPQRGGRCSRGRPARSRRYRPAGGRRSCSGRRAAYPSRSAVDRRIVPHRRVHCLRRKTHATIARSMRRSPSATTWPS